MTDKVETGYIDVDGKFIPTPETVQVQVGEDVTPA
jgi:hypothetical protein